MHLPPTAQTDQDATLASTQTADLVPSVARSLLGLVEDRGLPPDRLCRGLGFSYKQLMQPDVRLSHQQTRSLIQRAQCLLGEPAIGLAAGARQTPVSWGLPGLAMLTCETFGEAIGYGISHQGAAGAMVDHLLEARGQEIHLELTPRRFDLQIEPYLVEEAFASAIAISRILVGADFKPLRVDLGFRPASHEAVYRRFFRCPVRFDAGIHRMTIEARWISARLPGYDRITCGLVREQLDVLMRDRTARDDMVESLANSLRLGIADRTTQAALARSINVSDRTLRRRLTAQDTSFRGLRDDARYERARDLLRHSALTIAQVAEAVGYGDPRAFRRAFKRWSGQLPTAFRQAG